MTIRWGRGFFRLWVLVAIAWVLAYSSVVTVPAYRDRSDLSNQLTIVAKLISKRAAEEQGDGVVSVTSSKAPGTPITLQPLTLEERAVHGKAEELSLAA